MKKFLFLLLTAAVFTACDNDDDNFTPDTGSYDCLLVVTDASTGDETNRASNVVCSLDEQSDKSVSLTMKDVKFTDNPREPVKTIVFPKLACRNDGGTTYFEHAGTIVPEIGGAPYEDYVISNFECRLTNNASTFYLTFTCVNATYRLNHTATFNGTIIQ